MIEKLVSRERLDRALWAVGFFRLKFRLLGAVEAMPDGSSLFVRPDDRKIVHEVYTLKEYDHPQVGPGDTVIDAGANVGIFTVYIAKKMGAGTGRIISIEPIPLNLEYLKENISRNRLTNVEIYPCAVSEREGSAELYFWGDEALYSFTPPVPRSVSVPVEIRTLDAIARSAQVEVCHLLKIDVEGHEMAALKGAQRLLSVTKQVILEVDKKFSTIPEMRAYFKALGFESEVVLDSPLGFTLYAYRPRN